MTRNKNNARRAAARRRAAEKGISYTQARREAAPQEVLQDTPPTPRVHEVRLDLDLDHQGNYSEIMGYAEGRTLRGGVGKTTSVAYLRQYLPMLKIDGFDYTATDTTAAPGPRGLSKATLAKILEDLAPSYDHVFIDVPPGSGAYRDLERLLATLDRPRAHQLVPALTTVPAHTGDWTCTCGAWSAPDAWRNDIIRQDFERHARSRPGE